MYAFTDTPTSHQTLCVPRITLVIVPVVFVSVESGIHDSPNSAVPVSLKARMVGATNCKPAYVHDKCTSTVFEPLLRITVHVVNTPETTTDHPVATVVHDEVTTCDL